MKTLSSIILSIPTPCHESWDNMTPADKGRFCLDCQKTVTDFTRMSDNEIISFFRNPQKNICGRFLPEQLNRDISMQANTRRQPISKERSNAANKSARV